MVLSMLVSCCRIKEETCGKSDEFKITYFKTKEFSHGILTPCSFDFKNGDKKNIKDTIIKSLTFEQLLKKALLFSEVSNDKTHAFDLRMKIYVNKKNEAFNICIGDDGKIIFNNKYYSNIVFCFLVRIYSGFYCYIHPESYRYLPEYFMIKKFWQLGGKIEDKSSLYKVVDKGIGEDSIPYEIINPL